MKAPNKVKSNHKNDYNTEHINLFDTNSEFEINDQNSSSTQDILMHLIYLGCKLSSQQSEEASKKIIILCNILSQGYQIQREHL